MTEPAHPIDYDRLAAEYARNRQVHPGVLADLIATAGLGPDSKVLEVGCGTGNYAVALESTTGCACWGCDPSEEMLALARRRSPTIFFQTGRAEALHFPTGFFDLVFSVDVIHHVVDRARYFGGARRVLAPGGRVCTVTDSEPIIRGRRPLSVYFPETVEADLARYPRVADLRALMARAGFATTSERTVELTYELTDARPYRERAYSALHLIPPEAYRRGLARLESDLRSGPVPGVSRYLLLWGTK